MVFMDTKQTITATATIVTFPTHPSPFHRTATNPPSGEPGESGSKAPKSTKTKKMASGPPSCPETQKAEEKPKTTSEWK